MNGSSLNQKVGKESPQFDTWILHLPPINLYNVELVYLAFGYRNDVRSELDQRGDIKEKYGNTYGNP